MALTMADGARPGMMESAVRERSLASIPVALRLLELRLAVMSIGLTSIGRRISSSAVTLGAMSTLLPVPPRLLQPMELWLRKAG